MPALLSALIQRCHANPAPMTVWERDFLADIGRRACLPSPAQVGVLENIAARVDAADVARQLAAKIEALVVYLIGDAPTTKGRVEWRFRQRGSLAVIVSGADRGSFFDHEAGAGGDALELVRNLRQCSNRDAIEWARAWLGGDAQTPAPRPTQRAVTPTKADTTDMARTVWHEALAPSGTPAETYLTSRGLALPDDAPLRFHPACPRGAERLPAMLALMSDPITSAPCGVHRTFLRPDGAGKVGERAKMMLGHAGVIRLVPDSEVTLGLGLAEGIETALAVMQRSGWRPVWAATSAGAIARFPILRGIEAITLFADADSPGLTSARTCCQRWADAGREARLMAPPVGDWADTLPSVELAA